ncbi:MAG: hypothetical protein RRZ38_00135 [Hafnia sp.]
MDSMNLLPVNTDSGVGGPALGAFAGALFGSWFGDGFGGRGYGAGAAPVAAAVDTGIVLDNLNTLQQSVNGVGMSVVNGVNGVNTTVLQSANQIGNGICEIGFQNAQNTAQVVNAVSQGFSGLNTAIVTQGYESRLATQAASAQAAECCCEIKGAILADGQATRALIDRYAYENLQTQLCDAKAKISTLETQNYLQASQAAQTQQIINTVIAHLPAK